MGWFYQGFPKMGKKARPWAGLVLVEAAGQRFHVFRHGLDYTFILPEQDAGRVIHRVAVR